MAKYDPSNDLPHPDRTLVSSKAYGKHTRARRGTRSKVELNETLKAHTLFLKAANVPARLVKREIDLYRAGFPSGQLWQFLVGMFKTQLKMKLPLSVDQLFLKDIARDYPITRLLKQGMNRTIISSLDAIKITFEKLYPQFRRQAIDGYVIEVAVMFFDFEFMESTSDSSASAILPLNYADLLSFELNSGQPGNRYMIALKLMGCVGTEIQIENSAMAMQIIETGMVGKNGLEKAKPST